MKIVLALLGIGFGLVLPIYAAISTALSKEWLEILLLLFPVAGFLLGIAAPFLIEYRGRLTIRSFLGEVLLMLIAFVFVGGGIFLGFAAGIKVGESVVTSDGTGLAVSFFLFSGAIVGIIPGSILGALAITLWKFRSSGERNSLETISRLR
ncbi:MAG: hypothetical protein ACR2N3_05645 [Pyrinomonadaceae bacterium]